MKLRLLSLFVLATAAFASQQASADTIAVLNFQQIMHDSSAGKSMKDQLDAKQKSFQREMSTKESELNKEQESLAQQKAVLSPDAFEKKLKAFRTKTSTAQRDLQEKRGALDNGIVSGSTQIQKAVLDIVSKMSKEKGYTLVLPTDRIIFADPKLDITSDVLAQLNTVLPKVTVSFTAPANATGRGDE